MKKQLLGATLLSLILTAPVSAVQPYRKAAGDCKIELKQDTLTIENNLIKRSWLWNNGNLITCKLEDKGNGLAWQLRNNQPDLSLPGEEKEGSEASIRIEEVPASLQYTHHLRATVEYKAGNLQVRKILKIYPDCPAIACELYLKGQASQKWIKALDNPADLQNIEKLTQNSQGGNVPVMEQLMLEGKHWQAWRRWSSLTSPTVSIRWFILFMRFLTGIVSIVAICSLQRIRRRKLAFSC
ncbi:MAG: hypothetical protein V8T12_00665 [Parabacteroides johnsonii]